MRIGILGLQGSVAEHKKSIELANLTPVIVKTKEDLNKIDGLILPGGESTTFGILLNEFGLLKHIKERIESGMPVWGTCAGMILLAKQIIGQKESVLSVMDITVKRNAYGSQLDSFYTQIDVPEVSEQRIPAVFIRAPYIETIDNDISILAKVEGKIVAVRQNNMLATSFHPELTDDLSFYRYFCGMIDASK